MYCNGKKILQMVKIEEAGGGIPYAQTLIDGTTEYSGDIDIPDGTTEIKGSAFNNCTGLIGNLVIPNSVTTIGNSAFNNCTGLIGNLVIPNSVTTIGQLCFNKCGMTGTLTLSNNMNSAPYCAFCDSKFTGTLTLPSSFVSFGNDCFKNCKFSSVVFEGQASTIGNTCFYGCSQITKYDFRNCTTIPTLSNTVSLGHAIDCQIIVPDALYDNWIIATNWSALTGVTFVKASEYVEA